MDLYLLTDRVLRGPERRALMEQAPLGLGPVYAWGGDDDGFTEGGTDF